MSLGQYAEIIAQYSNCHIQLDHNTNIISITDPYTLTVTMPGVPSHQEGIHVFKPTQAYWSL